MKKKVLSQLRECLASGDVKGWLEAHPEQREALLPYLELDAAFSSCGRPEPSLRGVQEGRRRLLTAVAAREAEKEARRLRWLPAPVLRAATVLAVAALALGLAAGASALGGRNLAGDVLSTLGISEKASNGINNAPDAADNGRQHANPNAFQGSGNAEGAADHQPNENANPNAGEGPDNADDGINNASENAANGVNHANPNAFQGSGNAEDGPGNAPDDTLPDATPPVMP